MPAGKTYESIATTTLTSAQTSISFTSISGSYTDLIIIINGQDSNGYLLIRYNNDSGSNYSRTVLYGDGANPQTFRQTSQTSHFIAIGGTNFQGQKLQINSYSNTTTYKTSLLNENRSDSTVGITVGSYRSTSAITRVDFISPTGTATIASGTTITLYGVTAA